MVSGCHQVKMAAKRVLQSSYDWFSLQAGCSSPQFACKEFMSVCRLHTNYGWPPQSVVQHWLTLCTCCCFLVLFCFFPHYQLWATYSNRSPTGWRLQVVSSDLCLLCGLKACVIVAYRGWNWLFLVIHLIFHCQTNKKNPSKILVSSLGLSIIKACLLSW